MLHPVRSAFPPAVALFFLVFVAAGLAQSSVDEVHVVPRGSAVERVAGVELATATLGPTIPGAVIRTSADLVMVPVTIIDDMNRPVIGLDEDNFQVFENKKRQEIKHFSSEDAPVSIGIIVDSSGSMKNKLDRAREAVLQFCEASNPQDEFFLITFSDEPQLATDFTSRPEEIENALLTVQPKGRTSLLDAIYMGIRKMKDAHYARRALLVLSDGGDNHSRYSEKDVKHAVQEADVLLYAVGTYDQYFSSQEEMLGPELLRNVSDISGGQAFTLNNLRELPEVTGAIGMRLRHQYMLAYRPESSRKDGKWQKISVKLRLPHKMYTFLRVQARTGYYAAAQ